MSLLSPLYLKGQTQTLSDSSVQIVKDANNRIGYIIPLWMAVEYRNLRKEYFQPSQDYFKNLEKESKVKDYKISNLTAENSRLSEVNGNNEKDIQNLRLSLKEADDTISKQNRTIKRYKWLTYSCGAINLILGGWL